MGDWVELPRLLGMGPIVNCDGAVTIKCRRILVTNFSTGHYNTSRAYSTYRLAAAGCEVITQ